MPIPLDIVEFCRRPVLITTLIADTNATFYPWNLWYSNAAVTAKLRNYYLLRGTMALKFVKQTTPFTYGAGGVGLDAGASFGATTYETYNGFCAVVNHNYGFVLDYGVDVTYDLDIPYFSERGWMAPASAIGLTDHAVTYTSFASATDVNSVTPPVFTINVYAYIKDVKLASPVAQSGKASIKTKENRKDIKISAIASKFADAGNALKDVPFIGGIAGGVATIADKISSVAAYFGFSRPLILTDYQITIPRNNGEFATVEGGDTSISLAMDPKCSKSVDGITVNGSPFDELALAYITNIYGFQSSFTMLTTQATGVNLYSQYVSPAVMLASGNGFLQTPLSFASLPFSRWTGDIIYKITLFASSFHRGKIRVYWNQIATITDPILNVTLVTLLEVEPGASVEFTVPWNAYVPSRPIQPIGSATAITTPNTSVNGFLFIDVDQQLVAPRSGASVVGLIQVKAGKNFKVFSPSATNLRYASYNDYVAHAEAAVPAATVQAVAGVYTPIIQSGDSMVSVDTSYVVPEVFGEAVGSLRPLLKRYTFYLGEFKNQTATAVANFQTFQPRFPYLKWDDGAARHTRGFTLIGYMLPAYYSVSGSTRLKFRARVWAGNSNNDLYATRTLGTVYNAGYVNAPATSTSIHQYMMDQCMGLSFSGSALQATIAEVELPDMYGLRSRNTRTILTRNYTDYGVTFSIPFQSANGEADLLTYDIFFAGGDDFTLYAFCGPPTIYFAGVATAV